MIIILISVDIIINNNNNDNNHNNHNNHNNNNNNNNTDIRGQAGATDGH